MHFFKHHLGKKFFNMWTLFHITIFIILILVLFFLLIICGQTSSIALFLVSSWGRLI